MKSNISLIFFLFLGLSLTAQTTTETISIDGLDRTYEFHIPASYDGSSSVPLVLGLHGLGDTAMGFMNGTQFNVLANANNFIVAYPQGELSAIPALGAGWNNGTPLPGFPDDVKFITMLIDHISTNYNINPDRVYIYGFSMGSIMSHRLGCEISDKLAAIATVAGPMANTIITDCAPGRPLPVMHIHGTDDTTVDIDGSATFGLTSAQATIDFWVANNNCDEAPVESSLPDSASDGLTTDVDLYINCDETKEVLFYTVNGASHTGVWMAAPSNDWTTVFEIWDFFERHQRTTTSSVFLPENELSISVSPNPTEDVLNLRQLSAGGIVSLFDMQGRKVIESAVSGTSFDMDLSVYSNGTYFVRFTDAEGRTGMQKVVKK